MSYPPPPSPGGPAPQPSAPQPQAPAHTSAAGADPAWPSLPDRWWRGTQPHATFPVPYTLVDGFGLFAWFILGQVVIGLPLSFLVVMLGVEVTDLTSPGLLATVLATQASVILSGLGYLKLRGRLNWRLWGPIRPRLSHVGWGLLVGVGGFLSIQVVLGVVLSLLDEADPPEQELLTAVGADPLVTLLIVIAAVVLAPIGEELVFRGVLFQALRRRVGLWASATISSAVFGVVHVEVIGVDALPAVVAAVVLLCLAVVPRFPLVVRLLLGALGLAAVAFAIAAGGWTPVLVPTGLAALGFVLALTFHRTGSLLVPIVGHATFNAIAVGLTLLAHNLDLPV
ncbi:CPBP family intramembrane glutamic endopeptidase [Nitriliruptor alkaliphilus]|uniref:CPBP family intramembrane glutamic endopeptidase n=1 Tax=Nitriliruptor alkaliphilus TaxID=427918 RepID=UPI0006961B7B|nr:type II CAAX endopeptidase family protein [Nitriliruptor alkaliphilus]